MDNIFLRTRLLIGNDSLETLKKSHVGIFGLGGVGSFAAEAICRAGVGNIDVFDGDSVDITNINRQIIADMGTVGKNKAQLIKLRMQAINPNINVKAFPIFYKLENCDQFDFSIYDYILDAIDMVSSKIELARKAQECKTPIISCMGMGDRINPLMIRVGDIYSTSMCPLARSVRQRLRKVGIPNLKVVFSTEKPIEKVNENIGIKYKNVPGSVSFVPSVAGLIMAAEVIKSIAKLEK